MRALALSLITILSTSAWADTTIEVRGRMRIQIDRVDRDLHGLTIAGQLVDEALGEPLGERTVALHVTRLGESDEESFVYDYARPTDGDGSFRFEIPHVTRARYRLQLSSGGSPGYAAVAPILREIDLSRRTMELQLFVAGEHPSVDSSLPVNIELSALDHAGPHGELLGKPRVETIVHIDVDGKPSTTLAIHEGRGSATLTLADLASKTALSVHAHFDGDDSRGPAEATARVHIVEPAVLTLQSESTRALAGEQVTMFGRLRYGRHALGKLPIEIRQVSVNESDTAAFAVVSTDAEGQFRATITAPDSGVSAAYQASFSVAEAKSRGLKAATSEIVLIEIQPRLAVLGGEAAPARLALSVGAFLLFALLVVRLVARLRAWRVARASRSPDLIPRAPLAARIFGTLRIASDVRVAGRVQDTERARPIEGARVRLHAGDASEQGATTDAQGRFAFAACAPGQLVISVEHDGHASTKLAGAVPHRGELAALEIEIAPLRAAILRRYAEALEPGVRGEKLGLATPRELADAFHANTVDRRALLQLRVLVEVSCFSSAPIDTEILREVERLANAILHHASIMAIDQEH